MEWVLCKCKVKNSILNAALLLLSRVAMGAVAGLFIVLLIGIGFDVKMSRTGLLNVFDTARLFVLQLWFGHWNSQHTIRIQSWDESSHFPWWPSTTIWLSTTFTFNSLGLNWVASMQPRKPPLPMVEMVPALQDKNEWSTIFVNRRCCWSVQKLCFGGVSIGVEKVLRQVVCDHAGKYFEEQ